MDAMTRIPIRPAVTADLKLNLMSKKINNVSGFGIIVQITYFILLLSCPSPARSLSSVSSITDTISTHAAVTPITPTIAITTVTSTFFVKQILNA